LDQGFEAGAGASRCKVKTRAGAGADIDAKIFFNVGAGATNFSLAHAPFWRKKKTEKAAGGCGCTTGWFLGVELRLRYMQTPLPFMAPTGQTDRSTDRHHPQNGKFWKCAQHTDKPHPQNGISRNCTPPRSRSGFWQADGRTNPPFPFYGSYRTNRQIDRHHPQNGKFWEVRLKT